MSDTEMLEDYDFTDSVKNPYLGKLKKAITIRIDGATINYFKGLAIETGVPYQTLINLFLTQCAKENRRPTISW